MTARAGGARVVLHFCYWALYMDESKRERMNRSAREWYARNKAAVAERRRASLASRAQAPRSRHDAAVAAWERRRATYGSAGLRGDSAREIEGRAIVSWARRVSGLDTAAPTTRQARDALKRADERDLSPWFAEQLGERRAQWWRETLEREGLL